MSSRLVSVLMSMAATSSGVGHLFRKALELSPNMSEKSPEYSGKTWSSATMTWRFKSAAFSTIDWCSLVSWRRETNFSSASLLGSKLPHRSVSAMSAQSIASVLTLPRFLNRRMASVRMGFITTTL